MERSFIFAPNLEIILMKKLALSAFLLAGFMITSCDKTDDNTTPQNTDSSYLPVKINDADGIYSFKYDAQNRMIEMKSGDSETAYILTTFTYSGDQLTAVKEKEVAPSYTGTEDYVFTYQNNKVSAKVTYTNSNGANGSMTDVFTVDGSGRITNYDGTNAVYDANGNLTKMTNSYEEYTFEYDTKNGIFKNVKTPQWVFVYVLDDHFMYKVNNPIKVGYKDLEENQTYSQAISYTYNAADYPTKMIVVDEDNDNYTAIIQYNK